MWTTAAYEPGRLVQSDQQPKAFLWVCPAGWQGQLDRVEMNALAHGHIVHPAEPRLPFADKHLGGEPPDGGPGRPGQLARRDGLGQSVQHLIV